MVENFFKVLIITYHFPPSSNSEALKVSNLINFLQKYNWEVTVITSNIKEVNDQSQEEQIIKINNLIRLEDKSQTGPLFQFSFIKQPNKFIRNLIKLFYSTFYIPDNKINWSIKVKYKVIELLKEQHFDVILIICPPFSLFSEIIKIKNLFNIPIVVDYRELWYGNHQLKFPSIFHKLIHKKLEYRALKKVDSIIVSNRKIKENLIKLFPFLTFDAIIIIEQGFSSDDFASLSPLPRIKDKLILLHYGDFDNYSSAKNFLLAFKQIKIERPDIVSNIELHFVGQIGKETIKLIKSFNLYEYVFNYNSTNYTQSIQKILSADVLWFQINKGKNYENIIPPQLFYYIATKKPIIGLVRQGAAKMMLDNYQAFFHCKPDDIQEIKNTILKIFELFKNNSLPVVSDETIYKYRFDVLNEHYLKVLQSQIRIS